MVFLDTSPKIEDTPSQQSYESENEQDHQDSEDDNNDNRDKPVRLEINDVY